MNIFEILNKGNARFNEVSFSAILKFLIDPNEDHGHGDELLKRFLRTVELKDIQFNRVEVELEERTHSSKFIDIYLRLYLGENLIHVIIIENKIKKDNNTHFRSILFSSSC